jgi:predicted phosphodiesterase
MAKTSRQASLLDMPGSQPLRPRRAEQSNTDGLPVVRASGILFIPDAHIAATPPGQRLPGYRQEVMAKIAACLDFSKAANLVPVFLGDLFHWPRDNPNDLLVELMAVFRPHTPFVLVGNHDKYQARFTDDTSLAVLAEAGVARVLDEAGPAFVLETGKGRALIGASPDGTALPRSFERPASLDPGDTVIWITHHNLAYPGLKNKNVRLREIPGVDWVVNGHLHRPQPLLHMGGTRYANPGNITRVAFVRENQDRVPAAVIWRPGAEDLESWAVPHKPFSEVFPDQELPPEEETPAGEGFLAGIERLRWRRTREGLGLKQFLAEHLDEAAPGEKDRITHP